jgi:2-polyprenyl-3-methyl-5-hydroxy-6-metoxy-1,4-benzoquinol methylase
MVDEALAECCANPVDFFNNGGAAGERNYIEFMRLGYERVVSSVLEYLPGNLERPRSQIKILETASYMGVVAVALARAGYAVVATDIPEYVHHPKIQQRYSKYSIDSVAMNLRSHPMPWPELSFDAILFAEVLEHLNFNPLPVLAEFNRILKPNGCLYIATPNATWLPKRLRFLGGGSVHDPVNDYFSQLTASNGSIVGLHWREYTKGELFEMLERLGFVIEKHEYVRLANVVQTNPLRRQLLQCIYGIHPAFLPQQALWVRKKTDARITIKFTSATAPLLLTK